MIWYAWPTTAENLEPCVTTFSRPNPTCNCNYALSITFRLSSKPPTHTCLNLQKYAPGCLLENWFLLCIAFMHNSVAFKVYVITKVNKLTMLHVKNSNQTLSVTLGSRSVNLGVNS